MGSAASIVFKSAGAESLINSCYISEEHGSNHVGVDLEDLNTNHTWKPYMNVKLNVRELGIGEFFLEKNFNLISTSKSAEKKTRELLKWKKMVKYGSEKSTNLEDETQTYQQQNYLILNPTERCLTAYYQKKRSEFQKRLRLGPPQKYRCSAWKVVLCIENYFREDSYDRTLSVKIPKECEQDIKKDLHRTFPFEDYFNVEELKPANLQEKGRPRTATERDNATHFKKGGSDQKSGEKKKQKNIQNIKDSREVKNLSDLKSNIINMSLLNSMAQLNQPNATELSQKKEALNISSMSETTPKKKFVKPDTGSASSADLKIIRRNNNNSFPEINGSKNNEELKPTLVITGQEQLSRLLKAICYNFPRIGYCQGMNFIVGFLLIITGANELDSYWIFESLALSPHIHIIGLYEKDFPLVYLLVHIFWKRLKEEIPDLYDQLKEINLPDHVWITQWFMTIYLYSFPMQLVVRIWDFMLCDDILCLIKIALALLKLMKKELMSMDTSEVAKFFKSFKEAEYLTTETTAKMKIDPDELIKSAKKFSIKKKAVALYTKEFLLEMPAFAENTFVKFYLKCDVAGPAEYQEFSEEITLNYRRLENKITDINMYQFEHNIMPKENKFLDGS